MIAALFTNPNWDSTENDRAGRIKELNKHYNDAIEFVYDPDKKQDDEPDWDNPFWQGHLREIAKTRTRWGVEQPDRTMHDVIEADGQDVSQVLERASAEERFKLRVGVDQLR